MDLMDEVGRQPLRNRHLLLERGGHTLVVAGADDVTADSSGLAGHCAHFAGALDGADPALPVLLLAHQPEFIDRAAAAGIDLQLSGHTDGGQIWPLHDRVRLDQPLPGSATTDPAPSSAPRPTPPPGAVHRSKDRDMGRSPGRRVSHRGRSEHHEPGSWYRAATTRQNRPFRVPPMDRRARPCAPAPKCLTAAPK